MVHSLEGIPEEHHRDYYIYLLDYGWSEPLGEALRENFSRMATIASENKKSVVIMPTLAGAHFSDEVLSWHSINGDDADKNELLPAILVTNRHPAEFRKHSLLKGNGQGKDNLKMILFPLKKHCSSTTEVVSLIQKIFANIKEGRGLEDFKVTKEKKIGIGGAFADSIMLEPNVAAVGFSFNKFIRHLTEE